MSDNAGVYLAVAGLVLLVGWILKSMFGGRSNAPAESKRETRVWLFLQGSNGAEFMPATRDDRHHGYRVHDAFYPDEFCKPVAGLPGGFMLATHMEMPADGNLTHGGAYEDLIEVPQAQWVASWKVYDLTRRRLNYAAVFQRGDGSSTALKNLGNMALVVMVLWTCWSLWSVPGDISALNQQNMVISGQLAKVTGAAAAGNVNAPNQADGSLVPDGPVTPAGE